MTDSKASKKTEDSSSSSPTTMTAAATAAASSTVKYPPLEASARRLERLFGGGGTAPISSTAVVDASSSATTHNAATLTMNSQNPTKILKKWLGTTSSTSSITLAQIAHCAHVTLDPAGPCATGRDMLIGLVSHEEREAVLTDFMSNATTTNTKETNTVKDDAMNVDSSSSPPPSPPPVYITHSCREVESWLISLTVRVLWRSKNYTEAYDWSEKGLKLLDAHLADCSTTSTTPPSSSDVASGGVGGLYPLLARLLRYRSLTLESLPSTTRTAIMAYQRSELSHRHTTAILRHDADVSATVLNILLRDLLMGDQVEQAQKLLSNASSPAETASNNQLLRYLYYSGRIQALRLEYTSAYSNLSQALRKCPTNTGLGFRIAVQRLLVVVQLLMGEIPERSVFFGEGTIKEMKPYLEIAQAVRRGDLAIFHDTVRTHAQRLQLDGTYTLISRLAHSVVKAGLRRLKTSYSRISLTDVAARLGLPSATSAEFVVAKAVRDGVIDATINHELQYVQSHDLVDVYATVEPSEAFHRRIAYCLTTHNDAVRAMRYTPDAYKKQLEASRGLGRRGRGGGGDDEDKTDEEKAKEIEDEFDEDY